MNLHEYRKQTVESNFSIFLILGSVYKRDRLHLIMQTSNAMMLIITAQGRGAANILSLCMRSIKTIDTANKENILLEWIVSQELDDCKGSLK